MNMNMNTEKVEEIIKLLKEASLQIGFDNIDIGQRCYDKAIELERKLRNQK